VSHVPRTRRSLFFLPVRLFCSALHESCPHINLQYPRVPFPSPLTKTQTRPTKLKLVVEISLSLSLSLSANLIPSTFLYPPPTHIHTCRFSKSNMLSRSRPLHHTHSSFAANTHGAPPPTSPLHSQPRQDTEACHGLEVGVVVSGSFEVITSQNIIAVCRV